MSPRTPPVFPTLLRPFGSRLQLTQQKPKTGRLSESRERAEIERMNFDLRREGVQAFVRAPVRELDRADSAGRVTSRFRSGHLILPFIRPLHVVELQPSGHQGNAKGAHEGEAI